VGEDEEVTRGLGHAACLLQAALVSLLHLLILQRSFSTLAAPTYLPNHPMSKKVYSKPDRELEAAGDALYSRISGQPPEAISAAREALRKQQSEDKLATVGKQLGRNIEEMQEIRLTLRCDTDQESPYHVIAKDKSNPPSFSAIRHFLVFAASEEQAIGKVKAFERAGARQDIQEGRSFEMQYTVERASQCGADIFLL
jgi:hypothetical protein